MIEFGFSDYKPLDEFRVPKIPVGTKPIVIFSGQPFEVEHDYQRIKNLFLDFFSGPNVESIRLSGLEHVMHFVAADGKIFVRSYRVDLKKSGTRLPRIELEEIGPRLDLTVRRTHVASNDFFKRSLKRPEGLTKKKVKNINKDPFGSTLGRVHMKRQNYNNLSLRMSKAFRKSSQDREGKQRFGQRTSVVPIAEPMEQNDSNETKTNNNNEVNEVIPKKRVRFA